MGSWIVSLLLSFVLFGLRIFYCRKDFYAPDICAQTDLCECSVIKAIVVRIM